MRNTLVLLLIIAAFISVKPAVASSYIVDEVAVDQLFDNAVETDLFSFSSFDMSSTMSSSSMAISADKDAIVALILDFFLGGLGIHRFYLGTETISGLAYILTCGGIFGIVPFVDFIVMLINFDDISPYVNNPYFFMWKDKL